MRKLSVLPIMTVQTNLLSNEEIFMEKEIVNSRAPRSTTNREFSTRSVAERAPVAYGGISRFNLPPSVINKFKDEGYELNFVVHSSGGLDQKENFFDAIRRRHQPVPVSECPEIARQYSMSPFGAREADELYLVGGQTLMKRKIEDAEDERNYYDSEKARQEFMVNEFRQGEAQDTRVFADKRTRLRM